MLSKYEHKKVTSPYLEEIWVAQEQGIVTQEEAEKWAAYLREAIENERFLCFQTYVMTTGIKPLSQINTLKTIIKNGKKEKPVNDE